MLDDSKPDTYEMVSGQITISVAYDRESTLGKVLETQGEAAARETVLSMARDKLVAALENINYGRDDLVVGIRLERIGP